MRRVLLVVVWLLGLAAPALAQPIPGLILNPTIVEFDPSPDHDAVLLDGRPMLVKYEARYYLLNSLPTPGTEALPVVDLGKPTPVAGKIRVLNALGGLVPNTIYKAVVASIGQPDATGTAQVSNVSNPFANQVVAQPGAAGSLIVRSGT